MHDKLKSAETTVSLDKTLEYLQTIITVNTLGLALCAWFANALPKGMSVATHEAPKAAPSCNSTTAILHISIKNTGGKDLPGVIIASKTVM